MVALSRSSAVLKYVCAFSDFPCTASAFAKEQRAVADAPANTFVKVMHAKDANEGERLVKEYRQPSWPVEEGLVKLAAAWLIQNAGFDKGRRRYLGHVE